MSNKDDLSVDQDGFVSLRVYVRLRPKTLEALTQHAGQTMRSEGQMIGFIVEKYYEQKTNER